MGKEGLESERVYRDQPVLNAILGDSEATVSFAEHSPLVVVAFPCTPSTTSTSEHYTLTTERFIE